MKPAWIGSVCLAVSIKSGLLEMWHLAPLALEPSHPYGQLATTQSGLLITCFSIFPPLLGGALPRHFTPRPERDATSLVWAQLESLERFLECHLQVHWT